MNESEYLTQCARSAFLALIAGIGNAEQRETNLTVLGRFFNHTIDVVENRLEPNTSVESRCETTCLLASRAISILDNDDQTNSGLDETWAAISGLWVETVIKGRILTAELWGGALGDLLLETVTSLDLSEQQAIAEYAGGDTDVLLGEILRRSPKAKAFLFELGTETGASETINAH